MSEDIRAALTRALRGAAKSIMDEARSTAPLRVQKIAAYLPVAIEPEPTPEERERWRLQAAERERIHAERIASHPDRVAAAESPLREVLELHAPVIPYGYRHLCEGCDMDGYEAEPPEWPCRTYRLIAGWSE